MPKRLFGMSGLITSFLSRLYIDVVLIFPCSGSFCADVLELEAVEHDSFFSGVCRAMSICIPFVVCFDVDELLAAIPIPSEF